jgi:hypothetical protein
MGAAGMGDMPDMGKPRNSLLMGSHEGRAAGPFGSIFMGGMFTIMKVRENLRSYEQDPGWYEHPEGTVALPVGERRAGGATRPVPRQPMPALQGLSPDTTFQAIKANSCASMALARR